jgi:uracil phosphoribosyltransferase
MRDENCSTAMFRQLTRELGMFLAFEATRDLALASKLVKTPFELTEKEVIAGKKILVVPILRAGLVLAEGALEAIPAAHVGHIGFRRLDDGTYRVAEHIVVLPDPRDRMLFLLDPVIATGNTACAALEILKHEGVEENNIAFGTILVAPEGMAQVGQKFPNVVVHAISIESHLDQNHHIVPGFGDASDRLFGIKK